ncbi:MAG TPA: hypothetical protein VGJ21_02890 [Terracidiphilus sp.]
MADFTIGVGQQPLGALCVSAHVIFIGMLRRAKRTLSLTAIPLGGGEVGMPGADLPHCESCAEKTHTYTAVNNNLSNVHVISSSSKLAQHN